MNHKHKHLYIVTHRHMFAGYQAVQGMHAAQKFAVDFPDLFQKWYDSSNYLAFLSVEDETELVRLARLALERGIHVSVFTEPDMNFAVTAIAMEPGEQSQRMVKSFPLALEEYTC